VNNPSDVEKKIIIVLNLVFLCHASFALVNWDPSSAWIGAYFLGHIKKNLIHHTILHYYILYPAVLHPLGSGGASVIVQ
jgi:hypothetical protein